MGTFKKKKRGEGRGESADYRNSFNLKPPFGTRHCGTAALFHAGTKTEGVEKREDCKELNVSGRICGEKKERGKAHILAFTDRKRLQTALGATQKKQRGGGNRQGKIKRNMRLGTFEIYFCPHPAASPSSPSLFQYL